MSKASLTFALLIFILAELHGVPFGTAAFRSMVGYVAFWGLAFVWTAVLWPLMTANDSSSGNGKRGKGGEAVSELEDYDQIAA